MIGSGSDGGRALGGMCVHLPAMEYIPRIQEMTLNMNLVKFAIIRNVLF